MEPLAQATELLGAENYPTGSSVFVLLSNLVGNILKEIQTDSNVVKEMKSKICDGLQKRFKIDENGPDPRYKALLGRDILSPDQLSVVHKEVLSLTQNITPPSILISRKQQMKLLPKSSKFLI